MKAIVCKEWGLPETLVIEEQADLVPAAGEIVIDIMAAGVNFPDVLIIQNKSINLHFVKIQFKQW